MENFTPNEVYQIYAHISSFCGHPDPIKSCKLVIDFCEKEMDKLNEPPSYDMRTPVDNQTICKYSLPHASKSDMYSKIGMI